MTTTYESIDPSSTPDATYDHIQKPKQDYEEVDAAVRVNSDYLSPNPLYSK